MGKHFVIGDVHGMVDALIRLLEKLPTDAEVVFVGDLIDRGDKSAQVVEIVRSRGYRCVLGNHENTFIRFFQDYFDGMPYNALIKKWSMWLFANGGKETLQSYGFWENRNPSPPSDREDPKRYGVDATAAYLSGVGSQTSKRLAGCSVA